LGYILDEEDFEVVPTINRGMAFIELDENKRFHNVIFDPVVKGNTATYTIVFKPRSDPDFSFTAAYAITFTGLINVVDISRIIININNNTVFDGLVMGVPLVIQQGDVVNISVTKANITTGTFQLIGNTL
jgi:hypothetical protein